MTIIDVPVSEMTKEIMQIMEDEGLIIRLCPEHHMLPAREGETQYTDLYDAEPLYGSHRIIAITVNREAFPCFGTHPDNEEFWLIGNNLSKPMYILVARMEKEEFERKILNNNLTADDFYLLKAKYNDPETSFFVMKKNIPHGEGIFGGEGSCPTFYVTEGRDLPLVPCLMGEYEIRLKE